MSSGVGAVGLKAEIYAHVDEVTQEERGRDIDLLIKEIGKTNFDKLSDEDEQDKLDSRKITNVRKGLVVASLALAVTALVCAVATIIFSTGAVSAGNETVAVVTGLMGITTSFKLFDSAMDRYIAFHQQEKAGLTRINKLENKITDVKTLLTKRVDGLEHLEGKEKAAERAAEVLSQIRKVNRFIKKIKEEVPEKILAFDVFDPSPLLQFA